MRFSIIAMMYTLLLDILVFTSFASRQNEIVYEFNQRQQDIQVNYATDAATWMMLNETPDIDTDYTDLSKIKVSPEVALNTYDAMMIRGMGWSDDEETREYFEDSYLPFFIVVAYDGYYIYGVNRDQETTANGITGHTTDNTIYPKMWSPKIPFSEFATYGDDNKPCINIYSLTTDSYTRYLYDSDSYEEDVKYAENGGIGNASTSRMKVLVSSALTDACQKALLAAKSNLDSNQIIIPASFSQWSKNRPVEYPTVLAYMDAGGNTTKFDHVSFAIGGSRIEEGSYYISYIDEKGTHCYTNAKYRTDVETTRGLEIREVYSSATDAALNGYYFDLRYLN